ncbi:MAG TPA: hypothetical protein VHF58_02790 [Solirubrobacterales bacterium]|nr:hypothetical protein [Solirubrobacterales bacterium]
MALAILVAVAALLAGCGDDDETISTTTSAADDATGAISTEQWTAQADRICAAGDRAQQQTANLRFGDEAPTDAELEEFGRTILVPNLQAQHDAIAGLPKPPGTEAQIDAMLSELEDGIDAISNDPALLVQGTDAVPGIRTATELARELGLSDCGAG